MSTLSDEIRRCTKCIDSGLTSSDRLNCYEKPYIRFDVDGTWKPSKVEVLFIAESPPPNGRQAYFYNVNFDKIGLRKEVLRHLNLDSLEEFRDSRNYFLIDAIKCRLNKSNNAKTPLRLSRISRTCANRFLHREIIDIKPKTIFVLGNTAKQALEGFPEFQVLKTHRITDDFDEYLSGYRVILSVFPGGQTRIHQPKIERSFAKLS